MMPLIGQFGIAANWIFVVFNVRLLYYINCTR